MKKLIFTSLFFLSLNVYANDCPGQFDPQSGLCRFQGNDGRLVIYHAAPPNSSNNHSPSPKKIIRNITINIPSKYGALAQSRNGIIRTSVNENSLAEAKKVALESCNNDKKNKQCKILTWVRNGCYAAAAGKQQDNWFTFAWSGELGQTEQKVINLCEAKSSECRIVVPETCSIP